MPQSVDAWCCDCPKHIAAVVAQTGIHFQLLIEERLVGLYKNARRPVAIGICVNDGWGGVQWVRDAA